MIWTKDFSISEIWKQEKEEVIRLIDEQGKLTEELKGEIEKAEVLRRVEDLYKPYKQKKATRASKAKERGLEPLAMIFYAQQKQKGTPEEIAADFINPKKEVNTAEDAVHGAMDIIAEMIADDADLIKAVREKTLQKAGLRQRRQTRKNRRFTICITAKSEAIAKMPNHRVLAVNRGEKEKKLKVKVAVDSEEITGLIAKQIIRGKSVFTGILEDTIADAYKRLIAPSVEREMRNVLTERAEADAVKVFAKNTEKLLMVPPVKGKRVLSIDPGYRTGCKVAVLDETGKLKAYTTIYPTQPKNDVAGTEKTLQKIIEKIRHGYYRHRKRYRFPEKRKR